MGEDEARQVLDKAMTLRRKRIRKKWNDIAEQAGMKYQSLHRIRTNPEVGITDLAAAGIEDAMNWPRGTVAQVLSGRLTPEAAADLPVVEVGASSRGRKPLDPLTSSPEEIIEFLEEVRRYQGEEVYRELYEGTIEVQRLAAERERDAVTRKEHEEL